MLPETLSHWRKAMQVNRTQAAAMIGISRVTYGLYERGLRPIPREVALACSALIYGLGPCDQFTIGNAPPRAK